MGRQNLRRLRPLIALRRHPLEEAHRAGRVQASPLRQLDSDTVGFQFMIARIGQDHPVHRTHAQRPGDLAGVLGVLAVGKDRLQHVDAELDRHLLADPL